jgi:TonB family protein
MRAEITLALLLVSQSVATTGRKHEPPCLCKFVAPTYSPIARQAWIRGEVTLRVGVRPDGSVSQIDAQAGNPILAESATKAVKGWRFCSASEESSARDVTVIFQFRLEGPGTDRWAPTYATFESPASVLVTTSPPAPLEGDYIKKPKPGQRPKSL